MAESKVAKELDYKSSDLVHPEYKMSKIYQQTGSQTVSITTAGNSESVFELPVNAMNLSKSVLNFTATPQASGGGNYNYAYMDCASPIRQIQLYTRGGTYLCDVNHANTYTKVVWKPETKVGEFLDMPNHDAGSGWGNYLQKCNANNQLFFSQTAAEFKSAIIDTNASLADLATDLTALIKRPDTSARRHDDVALADGTGEPSSVDVSFKEAKYFAGGGNNTATPVLNIKLPLGMIYNTILSLNKDLYFGEVLYLRIVWAPSTKIFYFGDDALSPGGGTLGAAAVNCEITNLQLYLAIEQNQQIKNQLMSQVMGAGHRVLIPYVHTNLNSSLGAVAQQNVTVRYNRGHGQRLMKVYHSCFNNTENQNTAYDNDNRADAKVLSFYTTLNNMRQQEFDIDTSGEEDYMILKDKLKDTAIMNADVYHYNWFWCDDYSGGAKNDDMVVAGLSLDDEQKWEIVSTTAGNALRHYTFAVCQREVMLQQNNIQIS
jgi:hypothetical protein